MHNGVSADNFRMTLTNARYFLFCNCQYGIKTKGVNGRNIHHCLFCNCLYDIKTEGAIGISTPCSSF